MKCSFWQRSYCTPSPAWYNFGLLKNGRPKLRIAERIPSLKQITPVYAVIVVFVYAWSLLHFLWRVPAWVLSHPLNDILANFAYMVVVNLFESLVVLLAPVL